MLKVFTFLLVLATLAAVSKCFKEPSPGEEEKCMKEFGITREELDDTFPLFTREIGSKVERKYKCYTKCLLKILGLREENGTFDVEQFAQISRTPERKEAITKVCNDCMAAFEHEKDQCEYSFSLLNCIVRGIEDKKKEEIEQNEQA